MKRIIILPLVISMLLVSSCEKIFLEEDEANTPINNFEIFWNDFDQHYSLFEVRRSNWDSIYNVYRPKVTEQTSDSELWNIFKSMITYLDDSHTMILQPKKDFDPDIHYFESGSSEVEMVEEEFSLPLLTNKYLENISLLENPKPGLIHLSAKIKDKNIGYIYLNAIEAENPDFIDGIINQLKNHKAIILDLRNNTGGSDPVATQIAGRFATSEKLIYTVEERNGPGHSDFSGKISYYSKKTGKTFYDKPLVVLTDKITVSAAEVLLLHLKSFEQVTQIGDVTAGDFSDTSMRRFLPNGWQYRYSIFKFLLPNGKSLDGIGHIPNVYVRNTEDNIKNDEDKVIETAVQFLYDTYGIE